MDGLELRADAIAKGANCEVCPLRDERAYVPSQIPQGDVKLAVVGEAPGFQEATYKKPFMGPSGKLLWEVLSRQGYKRDEVLLTNACLCRPAGNATPTKAAVNACRPRLYEELRRAAPDDILALGGTSTSLLVDDTRGIASVRVGPPKAAAPALVNDSYSPRIIPTWHPAYCLRTADAFPAFVSDIGKLKETDREPWTPPEWRSFDDPEIALQVLDELARGTGPLVVDIEVGIEKDTAFDHPNEYDMLCVGIAYAKRRAVVLGEAPCNDRRVLDRLRDLLKSRPLIAHNGKFDLAGLYPHLGPLELWFDTMLAHYVLDERPGQHGLKMRAVEDLGAPQYDAEIHKYVPRGGNYADIPRPLLYKYNAYDVACTWDLYELYSERLNAVKNPSTFMGFPIKAPTLREVHDFLVAAGNQLMYLELNGIAIDRKWSDELVTIFVNRIGGIEDALNEIISNSKYENDFINPRSPQQVKAFYEAEGIRLKDTTADTLETLSERLSSHSAAGAFTSELLLHRRQAKLYSTYVKGIRRRMYRGRVYTTYLLHGSTSGRLASRNPNLQNIVRDREIKKQFAVSNPDNVLIHCDYKQAEGRVVATLAQDEYLRKVFSSGEDLFTTLGMGLYGDKFDAKNKDQRVRVKAYFYGMAYGREAYSIAMEYGLPVAEAEQGLEDFRSLIPNVVSWQAQIRKKVLSGEDLITPFGRHRRFYLITEQNKKDVLNEALSFLPQSTASDVCLSALIKLRPMLKGKAFIRLTIHDALVAETHESRAEEVSNLIRDTMIEQGRLFTDYVPFDADVTIGKSWDTL